jgi:hypothetical protein
MEDGVQGLYVLPSRLLGEANHNSFVSVLLQELMEDAAV